MGTHVRTVGYRDPAHRVRHRRLGDAQVRRDPFLDAFGAAVRSRREQARLTQPELAWRMQRAPSWVGAIERGETNVTLLSQQRVAAALGVELPDLLREALALHQKAVNGAPAA
jgi:ribosome-binding protein aMBF1 (putative translation factor)